MPDVKRQLLEITLIYILRKPDDLAQDFCPFFCIECRSSGLDIPKPEVNMPKVVVLLQDGFETVEALQPVDYFRRAGFDVTTVSLEADKFVTSAQKVTVVADSSQQEVDFSTVDVIFMPGGQIQPEKYLQLKEVLDAHYAEGKTLAAICAAPQVFARLGYLQGKDGVIYPTMHKELTDYQARFVVKPVVLTDNLVMGRSVDAAADFAYAVIAKVAGQATADEVKAQNFYY